MNKIEIRRRLLAARRALSPADRSLFGHRIAERIAAMPAWRAADCIGCYLSLPDEVPTLELIQQALSAGKTVAAPVTHWQEKRLTFQRVRNLSEMDLGPMGILQPRGETMAPEKIDLMLVPGVGFDLKGFRLGYGQGFYDRYLADYPGPTLGLAFDLQIVPELPVSGTDVPVRQIATEVRIYQPPAAK